MRRSLLASLEIVAAFCVAHVAAGGKLPTVHWLLAAGASVFLASWLVIRLRFRMRWMVPALTVTQLWLHLSAPSVTFARDLLWVQGGPRRGPPGVLAPAH
ncbi:MAG: hypothetical protein GYA85_13670 [Propionibacterium sp.]|nr:hypothetical protein [Propionibacterium sp.]